MSVEDFEAVILTARTEDVRQETEELASSLGLRHDRLLMRSESELNEPDHLFKQRKLEELRDEGIEVCFAVEDRGSVEKMWCENGVECIKMPESHRLRHIISDRLRKLFPVLPQSFVGIYLDLYTRRFSG